MPTFKTFLALTLTLACSPGPSVSCQPTADQACSDWYGLTDPNALATLSTHELADTLNRMAQAYPLRSSWDPKALGRAPYRRFAAVLAQQPDRVQEVLARLRPDALAYLLDTCKLSGLTEVHAKALSRQRTSRALSLFLAGTAGACGVTFLAWYQPLAALGVLGLGAWAHKRYHDHLASHLYNLVQYLGTLVRSQRAEQPSGASHPRSQANSEADDPQAPTAPASSADAQDTPVDVAAAHHTHTPGASEAQPQPVRQDVAPNHQPKHLTKGAKIWSLVLVVLAVRAAYRWLTPTPQHPPHHAPAAR